MAAEVHLIGVHIDHPSERDKANGAQSEVSLAVTVGASNSIRRILLDEDALVRLIRDASDKLAILKGIR